MPAVEKISRYENDPWDQQPTESAKQYARFTAYATRPVGDRDLAAVAREYRLAHSTIWELAERFRWRERAALWDADRRRTRLETIAEKETQLAERAINLALVTTSIMARSLRALAESKVNLEAKDLPAFSKMAETLRKMAIDAPDQVINLGHPAGPGLEVPDFAGLSEDQKRDRAGEMARSMLRLIEGGKTA